MTDRAREFVRLHGVEWEGLLSSTASRNKLSSVEIDLSERERWGDEIDGFMDDGWHDVLSAMRSPGHSIAGQTWTRQGAQMASFNRLFRDSRETDYGLPYEQMRIPVNVKEDYVKVRPLSSSVIAGLEYMQPFKNDLSAVLQCANETHLVTASSSLIVIHAFSPLTHLPNPIPELVFDVKPDFESVQERIAATWSSFPHTINYIAVTTNFAGSIMLGACIDSGKIHLYRAETILAKKRKGTKNVKVSADYTLTTDALVWGLLFARCGNRDLVVASDNSRRVTVFCYLGADASSTFTEAKSEPVAHNLPSVTIIECVEDQKDQWRIRIGCASIAGSMYIFETTLDGLTGHVTAPILLDHVRLGEECWTVNVMQSRDFHQCTSLSSVFGDLVIDDTMHARRILHELRVLGQASNQHASSSLGGATLWQFFECAGLAPIKGVTIDAREWARRVSDHLEDTQCAAGRAVLVSGMRLISLLDADTMHCYSKMPRVFDFEPAFDETIEFSDRLSLSCVIPPLLIVLVASQRGKVLVTRICTYCGIIGMRQEAILSDPVSSSSNEIPRTIVGLATRDLSCGSSIRFLVYVTYSDGTVAAHELLRDLEQEILPDQRTPSFF